MSSIFFIRHCIAFLAVAFSLTVVESVGALPATSAGTTMAARQTFIFSNLPNGAGPDYQTLLKAAGAPTIDNLPLTHAEAWTVETSKFRAIETIAKKIGISVIDPASDGDAATLPTSHDMTEEQKGMMSMAMESKAATKFCVISLPDPKIMEYVLTRSKQALHEDDALVIALRSDLRVTVARTSVRPIEGGYIWHGDIKGSGEPVTLIWRSSGELAGQIYHKGHRFVIRHLGGEKFAVVEMIPSLMPPEHPPAYQMLMRKMPDQDARALKGELDRAARPATKDRIDREPLRNLEDAASASNQHIDLALDIPKPFPSKRPEDQIVIDVLVSYTAKAAAHYVDIKHELIELAIEEANQSFLNSGVTNVRLRLEYSYQTNYVEDSATHFDHVFRLADRGDGYMDEVHAIRDAYHADVVVLIVDDPNGCGLSAGVAPKADRAFAVVDQECAATSYSLAHEIGHILGARHDIGLDDASSPYSFGHGFIYGKKWRTVMSYAESCGGCPRLPIWSNPNLKVGGIAAGDAVSDNARVISEGALRVSRFR